MIVITNVNVIVSVAVQYLKLDAQRVLFPSWHIGELRN